MQTAARQRGFDTNHINDIDIAESCRREGQGGPCLTDAALVTAPDAPFVNWPLRRYPNIAAAIIAARVARWHCTSV
jgi:hypothetical protein